MLESMEAGSLYRLASIDAGRPDDESGRARRSASARSIRSSTRSTIGVAVSEMLSVLPEREQKIVYLRFFEGLTQSEIAEQIGISQMHVSRLLVAQPRDARRARVGSGGAMTWTTRRLGRDHTVRS